MEVKVKVSDYKPPPPMKREELKRLQFCNSKKLPQIIRSGGKTYEWVGIGWVETKPHPEAVIIID